MPILLSATSTYEKRKLKKVNVCYVVMKKCICFSTIVSLIFYPYSKFVNIWWSMIWFTFDDVIKKRKILLRCYKNATTKL